jgi:hypothetical protein
MKKIMMVAVVMAAMVWGSCTYSCNCFKRTGCVTFLAKNVANDSVIAMEVICADSMVYSDSSFIKEKDIFFKNNYKYGVVHVEQIDTGLNDERVRIRGGKKVPDGFYCECPK